MSDKTSAELREQVRSRYAGAARAVLEQREGASPGCCGESAAQSGCGSGSAALDTADCCGSRLYADGETDELPAEAVRASLGCGNPLAVADLHEGERVLDLGSGGGIDVLLSARRVGPSGFAYGVDMTDDMLTLARANAATAGASNVEFRKGDIEALPLPDASVDVVISNCVINLAPNKQKVFKEIFRVLRHGGRFSVSDIVTYGNVPEEIRGDMELWAGCIAGAIDREEYLGTISAQGFTEVKINKQSDYSQEPGSSYGIASITVEATKP